MNNNQFLLLKDRRFLPLFLTQFLGAFHDNLFKNAFVVLLLFGATSKVSDGATILTTLAAGVFILPFVLFSAFGGDLANKYHKHHVIRAIKIAELAIATLGTVALFTASTPLSFVTLFALGTHSAFFGPSKYSILPQHLHTNELIGGNALLNTGTFLAILLGTIIGTSGITLEQGPVIISALLFVCSLAGLVSSFSIPAAPAINPALQLHWNIFLATAKTLRAGFIQKRNVKLSIIGIAWFYFMGGMYLAQMPNYVHTTLNASEHVLTLFLVIFSVFIAIGGLINNRLLKGRVEATYVPFAILGITLFSCDLYWANIMNIRPDEMINISAFISDVSNWRILVDIAFIALCGGLFVVPLNAIVQTNTTEAGRARIMAGSAILNALFVAASSAISALLLAKGWGITDLFFAFAIANGLMALCLRKF